MGLDEYIEALIEAEARWRGRPLWSRILQPRQTVLHLTIPMHAGRTGRAVAEHVYGYTIRDVRAMRNEYQAAVQVDAAVADIRDDGVPQPDPDDLHR